MPWRVVIPVVPVLPASVDYDFEARSSSGSQDLGIGLDVSQFTVYGLGS